jgi:hypothetical protein
MENPFNSRNRFLSLKDSGDTFTARVDAVNEVQATYDGNKKNWPDGTPMMVKELTVTTDKGEEMTWQPPTKLARQQLAKLFDQHKALGFWFKATRHTAKGEKPVVVLVEGVSTPQTFPPAVDDVPPMDGSDEAPGA